MLNIINTKRIKHAQKSLIDWPSPIDYTSLATNDANTQRKNHTSASGVFSTDYLKHKYLFNDYDERRCAYLVELHHPGKKGIRIRRNILHIKHSEKTSLCLFDAKRPL